MVLKVYELSYSNYNYNYKHAGKLGKRGYIQGRSRAMGNRPGGLKRACVEEGLCGKGPGWKRACVEEGLGGRGSGWKRACVEEGLRG